jgi:aminoglycoside 2''-phosphotransferase
MVPLSSSQYLARIREAFPELQWTKHRRVQTIAKPDHVMILLDCGVAFRFENDEDTNLKRERAILDVLRDRLNDIPIPDYAFVPKASDFAGYHTIPGTRLSPWRFSRLSRSKRKDAAKKLGTFLSALHSYPVTRARSLGVEEGEKSVWHRKRGKEIFAERAEELERGVRRIFEGWIERSDDIDHAFDPVLTHDDLWYKHIYHNPSTGEISGIIDWGDILITDPAKDFYGFWAYGESFLDDVLSHYDHADAKLKERSFENFWGIAIMSWFSRPPGGRFFKRSTWTSRPFSEWPTLHG